MSTDIDIKMMLEAIAWADACKPKYPQIPKVGAIIAIGDKIIGSGRRGTGTDRDDDHAELNALHQVNDTAQLPKATLYTTLEPCTPDVRSHGDECCTELILQHGIKKVFVGILDPNQGVTGKGLWRLQESNNVEVELFPHALVQQIKAHNVNFIRSQQSLGAKIISPQNGDTLTTSKTRGRHVVRVRCLNPPTSSTHLFTSWGGLYWPQPGPFRQADRNEWEIDAHFGANHDHGLHIVTATELGQVLIAHFHKVVRWNIERRDRLRKQYPSSEPELSRVLGGDYFGISMTGLPKGLRSEDSITVSIA